MLPPGTCCDGRSAGNWARRWSAASGAGAGGLGGEAWAQKLGPGGSGIGGLVGLCMTGGDGCGSSRGRGVVDDTGAACGMGGGRGRGEGVDCRYTVEGGQGKLCCQLNRLKVPSWGGGSVLGAQAGIGWGLAGRGQQATGRAKPQYLE